MESQEIRKEVKKFKKARTAIYHYRTYGKVPLMRNGYRLATVGEVQKNKNKNKIKSLGFEKKMRLLNGYICKEPSCLGDRTGCLPISYGYVTREAFAECDWEVLVKEKERESARLWKKKDSACYELNGIQLRRKLYDDIPLQEEEKNIALALASIHGDSEVLYMLVKNKDSNEFEVFKNYFKGTFMSKIKKVKDNLVLPNYINMVESLLMSKFPSTPSNEYNRQAVVDYAIKCLKLGDPNSSGILIVELLIEIYSAESIINYKTGENKNTFLKVAIENGGDALIPIMTKLLSESLQSSNVLPISKSLQSSNDQNCYKNVLFEAVENNYCKLVKELLKNKCVLKEMTTDNRQRVVGGAVRSGCQECMKNVLDLFKDESGNEQTLFHCAIETGNKEVFDLLAETYIKYEWITDSKGRNFLHWAALNGQVETYQRCISAWRFKVDDVDHFGQNSLHFSAKGKNGHQAVNILIDSYSSSLEELINSRDSEGRTPLHLACAKGNLEWVEKIILVLDENTIVKIVKKCMEQPDGYGRTALQMAAAGGHKRVVQIILKQGCDPLLQRDLKGRTALHYAVKAKDAEVAVATSQCLLNKYEDGSDEKSLLLWASAAGIGTADESKDWSSYVKHFLLKEKEKDGNKLLENENTLLRAAARNNNVDMAWELLNRGARIKDILDKKWIRKVTNVDPRGPQLEVNVNNVINQIEIEKAQGPDRPSLEDNLGRNAFAEGLASLFLNKFIESPITVGIFGEWGMGKSSLMFQTEKILLLAASQLAFPNLVRFEKFVGAEKVSLSKTGQSIYSKIKKGVIKLLAPSQDMSEKKSIYSKIKKGVIKLLAPSEDMSEKKKRNPLVEVLEKYHPQYHAVYKSLACMDVDNQMLSSDFDGKSPFLPMRRVPRILTIRYNAWHYRDEHEAWAGLAVTITKEIEQAMTRAQRFSTCWKYSWNKNKGDIFIQILLPIILAIVLSSWIALAAWTLLRETKFRNLKYGSIAFTIIGVLWGALKSILSVVKPVSTQMMGYINSPDHTTRLGYQQEVISDINFLKKELGRDPYWFFRMICGERCWNWFGRLCDNVENTCIPKFAPAAIDQLRMITFVDDLDRCDDKVILQILSAINLVLAECKINVIMGIDKKVIQRAVRKHFEDNEDKDLAEKFICKIIQIPLSLPDPTKIQSERFLEHLLGHQPPKRKDVDQDGEDTDYGDCDTDNDVDDDDNDDQGSEKQPGKVEIDIADGLSTSSDGFIKKVCQWLPCNLSSKEELNDKEIYPLTLTLSTSSDGFIKKVCHWLARDLSSKEKLNDKEIHPLTFAIGARLTREMVLSNYTPAEIDILYKLRDFSTGNQKLPREWKLILTYRKLACNILSLIGEVHKHPNWKTELVAWIFICWQWKHEMNILIKGWKKYAGKTANKGKSKVGEDGDGSSHKSKDKFEPSLKHIVRNYVLVLDKLQANQENEVDFVEKTSELVKLKDCLRQDPFVKAILSMYGHDSRIDDEIQNKNNWLNLLEALEVQDITMKGIQLFQQFRLHCENDHLPWPLPESVISKLEKLKSSL